MSSSLQGDASQMQSLPLRAQDTGGEDNGTGTDAPLKTSKNAAPTDSRGSYLVDAEGMKNAMYKHLGEREYDVAAFYHNHGFCQMLARAERFQNLTLFIISSNAVWIGVSTDHNTEPILANAPIEFQIGEHFFCCFFTLELLIRFGAFHGKINCLRDNWFKFDTVLVSLMIIETWILPIAMVSEGGGGMGDASILRLLRLLRLTRMARLMKAMPELVIQIKGMAVAARSVGSTLVLLIALLYVFAIVFKQQAEGNAVLEVHFKDIRTSMWTLLIYGAFMDEISSVGTEIKDENSFLTAVFLLFVLVSSFTVLNMLIGVLCEVVSAVAAAEKEGLVVRFVKQQLLDVLVRLDHDCNGCITEDQFPIFVNDPGAAGALKELGVDKENLLALTGVIFAADDDDVAARTSPAAASISSRTSNVSTGRKSLLQLQPLPARELTFGEIIQVILNLRSSNTAMVKDIVDFQKNMRKNQERIEFAHEVLGEGQEEMIELVRNLSEEVREIKKKQARLETLVTPQASINDMLRAVVPHKTNPTNQTL